MKKLSTVVFFAALFFAAGVHAQEGFQCGNVAADRRILIKHPKSAEVAAALEQFTEEFAQSHGDTRDGSAPAYIIPMVFHVVHNYGSENISDAQIQDAVRQVNADFRKRNADTSLTIGSFQSTAADCKIEFRLARIDPNGNCTNGIDRVQSELTYVGNDDAKLNPWPRDKYLNVWVVKSMEDGVAGYSYYPSSVSGDPLIDGVILLSDYVGTTGTSTSSHAHTLSHEIGHYLNLKHCWGSTNAPGVACGNDNVNDTPETKGWTTCNLSGSLCNAGIVENVQNFMEYSYCSTMFTSDQRTRMQAALASNTSSRNHLWTSSNLLATGTDNMNYTTCAPQPVVTPVTQQFICAGDTVSLSGFTTGGLAATWSWELPGGNPSVSSDSTPHVVYSIPGTYGVSVVTSNAAGSHSASVGNLVTVLSNSAQVPAAGFTQTFENMSFPNDEWINASILPSLTWTRVANTGYSGVASMAVKTAGSYAGQVANFITPTFDLSGIASPVLTFRVAHARLTADDGDALRLFISTDCGKTWKLRYSRSGAGLTTAAALTSSYYTPADADWRLETVNLSLFANEPNARFRFEYTQGGGNNLFIDDINFNGATGIENSAQGVTALSVFPNPVTEGEIGASFNISQSAPAVIRLVAADGRSTELANTSLNAGHQLLRFDVTDLPSGYYTLWIQCGGENYKRSVIVKH